MSKSAKIWTCIVVTLVVTDLAVGISLRDFALCDTRKDTAPFVLPFALLVAYNFDIGWGVLWLALAQFPCYGVIFGFAWVKDKLEKVWWRLLLFHTLFGVGCTILYSLDSY
jgi:hypothetical protein